MADIKVQCPAKINLTLKITGKRDDGYHNIESIMQTISLYDFLTINLSPSDSLEILLSGNSTEIPYNEKNLVYKAVELYFSELTDKNFKVSIFIDKNIPVAAGLAGGSTDAAGALLGLNKLFKDKLSKTKLHELCAKLGSDLNFCLEGGTQMTRGRGEILSHVQYKPYSVSLIKPFELGISAKEAYTKFAEKFATGTSGREAYKNDLEWAVIDDYDELKYIKNLYPNSMMSGSGSTYFTINGEFESAAGYWVKNNLTTVPDGIKICEN